MSEDYNHIVVVLGSAQDGGLPQLGSSHIFDIKAMNDPSFQRMGASLAIICIENGNCLLLDASPDLRYQYFQILLQIPEYREPRKKNPKLGIFQGIILTHAHMGHYLGLAHLGKESANTNNIPTYVTPKMAVFLRNNAPWNQLISLNNIKLIEIQVKAYNEAITITPWNNCNIRLFSIPHRAEYTDTIGISINSTIMYIPDIDSWDEWIFAKNAISEHLYSFVDATFYTKDELQSINRDFKMIPHPSVIDTINRFSHLLNNKCNIILTHLNHSNPICSKETKEYKQTIEKNFIVAKELLSYKF